MGLHDINKVSHTSWNCKYYIVFAPISVWLQVVGVPDENVVCTEDKAAVTVVVRQCVKHTVFFYFGKKRLFETEKIVR